MVKRKGIVLAGGLGTRLHPITKCISKQLLPVFNKPMIYYSLSTLMLGKMQDILLISSPHDIALYQRLLGDGSSFGCNLSYAVQETADGLASAFLIGKDFVGNNPSALILGDNLFHGSGLAVTLAAADNRLDGSTVFGKAVKDPQRYGVATISEDAEVIRIDEKPLDPASNIAVTGLYYYDSQVVDIASSLSPSPRGEYEITDINNHYISAGLLNLEILPRGFVWLDTGTHDSMLEASQFVRAVENSTDSMVGCIEEIALGNGWISVEEVQSAARKMRNSDYAAYLRRLEEPNHESN